MEFGPYEVLCGIGIVFLAFYYFCTSSWNFWKTRGVMGPKPNLIFGTFKDVILLRCSLAEYMQKVYLSYPNEKMVGLFSRNTPMLMLKDPDLLKDVFIKDFAVFQSRNRKIHGRTEPLSENLVSLEPARWRPLRMKLSPTFTSGKLKEMFYILVECGDNLSNYLDKVSARNMPIEVRDLTAKFTTDVIGSCAFGLKMNAISDETSKFREMGKKIFELNWWRIIKFRIRESFPWLYDLLWPIFYNETTTNFFVNCIKQTIEYREKHNVRRNDFVDLLRDMKDEPEKFEKIEVTDTFMAAQAFVFFVAGFETSSTTISNALYELAQNQSIQNKVREEIKAELLKNEGVLHYDSVQSMTYLHKIFQETLRKYPPAPVISRRSSAEYTFSGTNVTIPKDQGIMIPVYAIHRDPNIYPDPEIFDPERFNEEVMKKRHPMTFLPFGNGPRNCIGARFAIYQSKVGLIKILQNFKVNICEKTKIPYDYKMSSVLLTPKNGIYLNFAKINSS